MKKKVCILLFILISLVSFSQSLRVDDQVLNSPRISNFKSVADSDANTIVLSWFSDSIALESNRSLTSIGERELLITKIGTDATILWRRQIGSSSLNLMECDIATDTDGNIYVSGVYAGALFFQNSLCLEGAVDSDVFLCKIDIEGKLIWCRSFCSGIGDQRITELDIASDCLFLCGAYKKEVIFEDGNGFYNHDDSEDFFYSKIDNNTGKLLWAKQIQVEDGQGGFILDTHVENDFVLFTGVFSGTISSEGFETRSNGSNYDIFIVKTNQSGEIQWGSRIGGTEIDFCCSTSCDQQGNIVVVGQYLSSKVEIETLEAASIIREGNSGENDILIVKYTHDGKVLWDRSIRSEGNDFVTHILHNDSDIVLIGSFTQNLPGESDYSNLTTYYSNRIFQARINNSGEISYIKEVPISEKEQANGLFLVKINAENNVILSRDRPVFIAVDSVDYTQEESQYWRILGAYNRYSSKKSVDAIPISGQSDENQNQNDHKKFFDSNNPENNWLEAYPNPATGTITIQFHSNASVDNCLLEVLNLAGQILLSSRTPMNNGHGITIDIHEIPAGVYIVQAKGTTLRKLIVVD